MFLAIDAGNTKVTLGFFDDFEIKEVRSFTCARKAPLKELLMLMKSACGDYQVEKCMICSVVEELTENLEQAVSETFGIQPKILVPQSNGGIRINSPHPEKCGADRVANAYAASKLYKNRPIIVVDSGSATTFDIVNEKNELLCGAILPGMELQLRALGEKTSKLPSLNLRNAPDSITIISDNTEEEMYAGVIVAHAQAVQGLLKLCEQELDRKAFVIGTGGNIDIVTKYINERTFDDIKPNLTLCGIRMLYDIN